MNRKVPSGVDIVKQKQEQQQASPSDRSRGCQGSEDKGSRHWATVPGGMWLLGNAGVEKLLPASLFFLLVSSRHVLVV